VALCLDLTLRQEGKISLDDVMRDLWQSSKGGPISEQDIAHSLNKLSGRSFQAQLKTWVHSTEELPCLDLLKQQGVKVVEQESSLALSLGLKAKENPNIVITQVLFGSAASKAGFSPQDEWYGVSLKNGKQKSQWRLQKIDDLELYASPNKTVQALVARDKRLIELELSIPARQSVAKLSTNNLTQVQQWLLDL
jgi:predicted metalloprotease with PDZ domain